MSNAAENVVPLPAPAAPRPAKVVTSHPYAPPPSSSAGLGDMTWSAAMIVVERVRREVVAELMARPSPERFAELADQIQALDLSLDALCGKKRR